MPRFIPAAEEAQIAVSRPERSMSRRELVQGAAAAENATPAPAVTSSSAVAPFRIRTSERRSFKRCQKRWEWDYKEGLKPLRDSNPLWFGQAVHLALAEWYKPGFERGEHPARVFERVLEGDRSVRIPDTEYESDVTEFISAKQLGVDMLERYVRTFGQDSDWEFIQPEMSFQIKFDHPVTGEKDWLEYVGTFDGVFRYVGEPTAEHAPGEIWLLENKTAASIQVHHLPLDDQAGSYWAVAQEVLTEKGILKPGEEIAGIMYNFLRKVPEDARPKNAAGMYTNAPQKQHYLDALTAWAKQNENRPMPSAKMKLPELEEMAKEAELEVLGDVSKQQPPPYYERIPVYRSRGERATMLQRIVDEGLHIEQARLPRPLLPIIKNPTRDCEWDCSFRSMCKLHEAGEDWQEFRDTMFKVWSPYEDHEVKAA